LIGAFAKQNHDINSPTLHRESPVGSPSIQWMGELSRFTIHIISAASTALATTKPMVKLRMRF
jgi:hypothetical protein